MRTVSLRARVVAAGVAVVALVVAGLGVFVYASMRDRLLDNLEALLDDREELVVELSGFLDDRELVERLAGSGVAATVEGPEGGKVRAEPPVPAFVPAPPPFRQASGATLTREVRLDGGRVVVLEASRAGVDDTLRRLLVLELVGSAGAVALATLLFDRAARSALRPLDRVVETARRIGGGQTGERLRPERTDTELGRMAEAFDEMLDSLESAMEAVRASEGRSRRFLADAAHQLRTPVAGIQGSAEALLRSGVTPDREELLVNLVRETSRMGKLVTGLLRVARLDEPGGLEVRPCDLEEVCLQEVGRLRQRAPGLRVTVGGSPPDRIPADQAALGEALANLLDNAHRHANSQVTVTMAAVDEAAEVRVTDDGPGLEETEAERAFERFVSFDRRGGSGLGLPIARAVARAHGGDLTYEGGAFVLRLSRR